VFQLSKRAGAVQPPVTVPETALFDENGRKQAGAH
jgi:flagellar biosynthetic protein FlhB